MDNKSRILIEALKTYKSYCDKAYIPEIDELLNQIDKSEQIILIAL
jgi:hypothetical protein